MGAPCLGRIAALDGLRAFAVFAVILFHISPDWMPGGFVGVDLFFVLSGYIITRGLLAEAELHGQFSIPAFYRRRALRLLPASVAMVATVFLVSRAAAAAGRDATTNAGDAAAALASVMNWRIAFGYSTGGDLGHAWSLSVEEQFYLLWPLLLLLLYRHPRLLATLLAEAAVISILLGFRNAGDFHRSYFASDVRAQGLIIGCLLAFLPARAAQPMLARLWLVPTALLALIVLRVRVDGPVMPDGGFCIAALASAWLIWAAAGESLPMLHRGLVNRPAQWLGRRSYSAYLWHYPIIQLVAVAGLHLRYFAPLSLLLSLIAADLSYRWLENGFRGRAWLPTRRPSVEAYGEPAGLPTQ